jgi:transposase-like protein
MYVKLGGEKVYLCRADDHEREMLESYVTRDARQRGFADLYKDDA